ncbi:MAG: LptF/LptG family permease [Planctomycetia bacterium]|nr:LptF/LptG family permease [Planctomycetia bacterium]
MPTHGQPFLRTNIIFRRVIFEIFSTFLLFQISLTIFFIIIGVVLQALDLQLPVGKIPMLIPYVFPFSQYFAVPLVVLLTLVTVYARMKVSREITALQTCGISSIRVIIPALIIGFILSFYTFLMYDLSASWGMAQTQRVFLSASQDILYGQLSGPQKSIMLEGENIVLSVVSVDGKILREPLITRKDDSAGRPFTISAREATIEVGQMNELWNPESGQRNAMENLYSPEDYKNGVLKITFSDVHTGLQEGGDVRIPEQQIVIIPLSEIPFFNSRKNQRAVYTSTWDLPKLISENEEEIQRLRSEMSLAATQQLILGNFSDFSSAQWNHYHEQIYSCQRAIRIAKLEPYRRISAGLSCFCFAIVAAPLAVWKGNQGALQLVASSLLPLLVFYYPAMMFLTSAAKKGDVVPMTLMIPNLVVFLLGLYMLKRAA